MLSRDQWRRWRKGPIRAAADAARDARLWPEAAALYRQYLERRPRAAPIWVQLGHALKESGDLAGAEAAYEQALTLAPNTPDTLLQMGHLLKVKGDPNGAIDYYRRALWRDPKLAAARAELDELGLAPASGGTRIGVAERVARLEAAWDTHLPAFLNAASTVGAFGFELQRTRRDLERRLAALEAALDARPAADPAPAVLDPRKFAAMAATGLRLNLNPGHGSIDGFIKIAPVPGPDIDVIAAPDALPAECVEAEEIRAAHVLDAFTEADLRARVLPDLRQRLTPGGRLTAILLDTEALFAGVVGGATSFEAVCDLINGEVGGVAARRSLHTPESFAQLLADCGFTQVQVAESHRPFGALHEFEIVGVAP